MKKTTFSARAMSAAMFSHIGDNTVEYVTVNGQQIPVSDIPEFKAIIESLASDERRKIYNRIKHLEDTNKALTSEVQTLKAATTQQSPQAPQPNAPQADHNSSQQPKTFWDLSGVSKEQIKEQLKEINAQSQIDPDALANAMLKSFEKALEPVAESIKSLSGVVKPLQTKMIDEYRAAKLAELGDTVIPDLVKGATEAEIDSSIAYAKEMRSKYAPVSTQVPANNPPAPAASNPPAPLPVIPVVQQDSLLSKSKGMSQEEFAKNREAMKKELSVHLEASGNN